MMCREPVSNSAKNSGTKFGTKPRDPVRSSKGERVQTRPLSIRTEFYCENRRPAMARYTLHYITNRGHEGKKTSPDCYGSKFSDSGFENLR